MNIERKLEIISQKAKNNWSSSKHSNEIISYQEKSQFISFLRLKLSEIKNSNNFESQLEKNLLRSLARFSEDLIKFAFLIYNEVSKDLNSEKGYMPIYFMKPYLMIHLPSDKSEEGIMHSDYEYTKDGFFTCWAPLEKYDFPALSTVGSFAQKISFLPKTRFLLKYFKEKSICHRANPGDVKFWSHSYLHKGNLNTSNHSSFVLVTKLSKEPLSAGSLKVVNGKLDKNQYLDDIFDIDILNYNALKDKAIALAKNLNEIISKNIFDELTNLVFNTIETNTKEELKVLSFFLSVQAQRIWARPNYYESLNDIKILDGLKLWKTLDFFSISIGCENISSLQRLINETIDFIPHEFLEYINTKIVKEENLKLWNKIYDKS